MLAQRTTQVALVCFGLFLVSGCKSSLPSIFPGHNDRKPQPTFESASSSEGQVVTGPGRIEPVTTAKGNDHRAQDFPKLTLASYTDEEPAWDPNDEGITPSEPPVASSSSGIVEAPAMRDAAFIANSNIVLQQSQDARPGWSLEALEQLAFQNNPSILQTEATLSKVRGLREQVGLRSNPSIGYNGTQLADAGTDQHTAFLRQDVITGGKLAANRAVLDREIEALLWEIETQKFRVQTDVRLRFYESLAAQRRRDLAIEFEAVANEGVRLSQQRLDARQGTRSELLQAELQLRQVQLEKKQAEVGLRGAWGQLVAAIGIPDLSISTLDGTLELPNQATDWTTRANEIVSGNPELQAAFARVAQARRSWERQRLQPIPNMSMGIAGGSDYGTGSGMINAELGFAVPVFNRNQGNIAAAYAELRRASASADRTAMALQSRLAQAIAQFETALLTVQQYEMEIVPRAQESITLAQQAFSAGELQFIELFVVRQVYFDSKFANVQALLELAQADALLHGMLLSGSLENSSDTASDAGLRDQALSGQ